MSTFHEVCQPVLAIHPRHFYSAALLARGLATDLSACPTCGGRLRIIAALTDPDSIRTDLQGVGRPAVPPPRAPPHTPVRVRRLTSSAMGAGEPYGERRPQWSQRGPGCSRLYGIDGSPDMAAKAWSKVFISWTLRRRQLAR